MLINLNADLTPIKFTAATITKDRVELFKSAVRLQYTEGIPPTYATTFRKGEFAFLDRFHVNLKNLLHTDQQYEYITPFCLDDIPEVTTEFVSTKERRGMIFVSIKSQVKVKDQIRVYFTSSFVLRETKKGTE